MSLDYPISGIDDGQWPFDIPTYKDMYSGVGMNVDKAVAFLWSDSALANWQEGRIVPGGSVTKAKRLREQGVIRINCEAHLDLRYVATPEDVRRGHVLMAVGKPSKEGGPGYELNIPVFEYLGEVHISREELTRPLTQAR
jgi:hypothetical protein